MAVLPDDRVPESHRRYAPGWGLLEQPIRESLPVDVLAAQLSPDRIEPGRLADAMAHLEAQLRLRELDAQHFAEWERTARSIGTPDALAEVAQVRTGFIDVISSVPIRKAGFDLEFSGNLPAVSVAASTAHARAVAELDTQAVEAVGDDLASDMHTLTEVGDRRVGDIGWKAHDAVYGDTSVPPKPARRRSIGAVAQAAIASILHRFASRNHRETAR